MGFLDFLKRAAPEKNCGVSCEVAAWTVMDACQNPVEHESPVAEQDGRATHWPDLRGCRMPDCCYGAALLADTIAAVSW